MIFSINSTISKSIIISKRIEVEDEENLIKFISNSLNLEKLEINNSSLTNGFYDQLPSISSLFHFTY